MLCKSVTTTNTLDQRSMWLYDSLISKDGITQLTPMWYAFVIKVFEYLQKKYRNTRI